MTCELSIVIVHYETPDLLKACLASIFSKPADVSFEVIVIDNDSTDRCVAQLAQEFTRAKFHFNTKNIGFAAACNQAIRLCHGPYILILNPDTLISPDILSLFVSFMDAHQDIGVCGPKLVYPDGTLQFSCRQFPTLWVLLLRIFRLEKVAKRTIRAYLMADWDHAQPREVDWVIGGCMLLRREVVVQAGCLDERFFMYYEDIDLCYRIKQMGWKVYYYPQVTCVHHHRRTSANFLPNKQSYHHAKSLWQLFFKYGLFWP